MTESKNESNKEQKNTADIGAAFARLLKVKSLMTLIVAIGLVYGFICCTINAEQFMVICTMVFTFYFARNKEG